MDSFQRTAVLRRQVAETLAGLTTDQLATRSLCDAWTVKEVGAHLVVPIHVPMRAFMWEMVKARGNFDVANDRTARQAATRLGDRIPAILREKSERHFAPPGGSPSFQLADVMIHGQDIRRPLGIAHTFEEEDLREVLELITNPTSRREFIPRRRFDGIRVVATDVRGADGMPWSFGEGPTVEGPAEAIILAASGRSVALADLSGDGVAILAEHTRQR
jgi:uncharacterized protein (TIGR03083 family)